MTVADHPVVAPAPVQPGRQTGRLALVGLVVFLLSGAALIIFTGPVPQLMFAPDVLNLLDGAQRQWLGQVAHRDFHSPLGGFAFLPFSTAMRFTGPTVAALPLGVAFTFVVLTTWAWILARRRVALGATAVFTGMIGLLAAATYALDFGDWSTPSYAMYYNRTCWALLGLVALECFVPAARPSRGVSRSGGASTGAALAGLLLVKFNFFGAALGLVAGALLLDRGRWRDWGPALLAGFFGTAVAAALAARIDLVGYAREIAGMAASVSRANYLEPVPRILSDNTPWLVAGFILVVCLVREALAAGTEARRQLGRAIAAFGLVIGAGLAVSIANCQFAELPTFPLALLILAAQLRDLPASRLGPALGVAAAILGLLFSVPQAGMLLRAAARHQLVPVEAAANGLRLDLPAVNALGLRGWPGEPTTIEAAESIPRQASVSPLAFGQWLQDGTNLLRPHVAPTSRVLSVDWANPFPFCLGLPPVPGDHIAWHYGRVVGDSHHPDVARLVAQADFVMEPRAGIQPDSLAFKKRLFDPLVASSFTRIASSRYWILWQRRPSAPAPSVNP